MTCVISLTYFSSLECYFFALIYDHPNLFSDSFNGANETSNKTRSNPTFFTLPRLMGFFSVSYSLWGIADICLSREKVAN